MSFLDELREEAKAVEANATLVLPVNGSRFLVRFRPPSTAEALIAPIAALRVVGALSPEQVQQLIVDCCDEILRRDEHGALVPVDPEGGPLRFDGGDERWGSDVKTARDAVAKFYKLDKRPLGATGVADALIDWLQGIHDEAARRVEGESDGGEDSSETPPASTSTD